MSVTEARPQSSLRKDDDFDDLDRELMAYIGQHEEKSSKEDNNAPVGTSDRNESTMEKRQREGAGTDKKERLSSDSENNEENEESDLDMYNLTEDQRRALEELDNLKSELGYPDEEPPEYDVKERLKEINEDLANDPTPTERSHSKVGFKQNLVDLVAPPPDYGEEEEEENKTENTSNNTQKQSQEKDKTDEKSETISAKKSNTQNTKEKVLIEREGQFELVNADDVRAQDLGLFQPEKKLEIEQHKTDNKSQKQPVPPAKPRPATATINSRRNIRVSSVKQRPQSAGAMPNKDNKDDLYNSPYAMSPREKELMEERKKALEKQRKYEERQKKLEEEYREKENREAFEAWLKKKKEESRRKKIEEEEDRKQNDKQDREDNDTENDHDDEEKENEEAFRSWLKEKSSQFKKEKLLKRRQDQEAHDGYYVRSREDCDKAFRQWLKHKAQEARKARAAERMKARLHRLAARRSRKSTTLAKAIKDSQAFRYVDYYGYRF